MNFVAADVRRLISFSAQQSEPPTPKIACPGSAGILAGYAHGTGAPASLFVRNVDPFRAATSAPTFLVTQKKDAIR